MSNRTQYQERKKKQVRVIYELLKMTNSNASDSLLFAESRTMYLQRLEKKMSFINEKWCNGEITEEQFNYHYNYVKNAVNKMFNNNLDGFIINTDPRGYALKIEDNKIREKYLNLGIMTDWGGYGLLAPEFN